MWWHSGKCLDNLQGPFFAPSQIAEVTGPRGKSFQFLHPAPANGKSPCATVSAQPVHMNSCAAAQLRTAILFGPPKLDDEASEMQTAFRKACANKYRNLSRAWQLLLDPDRVGR